jgi:inosose dehydratase
MVGTAPVNWGLDPHYTWLRQPPFEEVLAEMAEAGYAGSEIGYNYPLEPNVLAAAATRHGLRLTSRFCSLTFSRPERLEAELRDLEVTAHLLYKLGSDVVVVADAGDERREALAGQLDQLADKGLGDAGWGLLRETLHAVADRLAPLGLRLAFHNHAGTYVETELEVERLCQETDPDRVGLCLDTGHLIYGGGDPARAVRRYGSRIVYVHLKDVDRDVLAQSRQVREGFLAAMRRGVFVELGRGCIDFVDLKRALDGIGYDGWLIVEQDTTHQTPLASAIENREFLRRRWGL